MLNLLASIWRPVLEIGILWSVFYWILSFFRGTRAFQVFMGFLVLVLILMVAQVLGLSTLDWVLTKFFAFGVIFILIVFQPEIRRALARLGQNTFFRGFMRERAIVDDIVEACERLSKNRIGALLAIERETGLKNYIESGVELDSKVSPEAICTVFSPGTPLHDGGIIIQGDRIASAGSLFPLTQNAIVSKTMGTRHRAAIGLSEESDAVVVVVSEETRTISVAVYGRLTRDLDTEGLRRVLKNLLGESAMDRHWPDFRALLQMRPSRPADVTTKQTEIVG